MPEFYVCVREIHTATYIVEAEDENDARNKFKSNPDSPIEVEFEGEVPDQEYQVFELDKF